jgi:hypothetical protein
VRCGDDTGDCGDTGEPEDGRDHHGSTIAPGSPWGHRRSLVPCIPVSARPENPRRRGQLRETRTEASFMGWRERDWARFDDAERRAFYGAPPRKGATVSGRPLRTVLLCLLVSALAGTLLAVHQVPTLHGTSAPPAPAVIYGIQGTQHVVGFAPNSTGTACTEEEFRDGAWQCGIWTINFHHVPVAAPRPYNGPCVREEVDQDRGAWTCLEAPPAPTAPDAAT